MFVVAQKWCLLFIEISKFMTPDEKDLGLCLFHNTRGHPMDCYLHHGGKHSSNIQTVSEFLPTGLLENSKLEERRMKLTKLFNFYLN